MKITNYENSKTRVNYSNMNVLDVLKINDYYMLEFNYKEKIKKEVFRIPKKFKNLQEIGKLLNPLGFRLFDDKMINVENACIINKELIENTMQYIDVTFIYNSCPSVKIRMKVDDLLIIESHYLVF